MIGRSLFPFAAALGLMTVGCGGEPPQPKAPERAQHEDPGPRPVKLALKTKSELGTVDPAAVQRSFTALDDRFMDCQKRALDRVEVLSGKAKFFLRIGEDGAARWTYLEQSEIGDRDTEKCLLDVVSNSRWPKPDGGEAESRYDMELPMQSTRPANDWSSDKVLGALGRHADAIRRCKGDANATFHATMYVASGGKVLAAGVATSGRDGADKVDCLAKALEKLTGLPSPGSWPAKVSFGL